MAGKRLSNPISTGGGGQVFESHVQSSFCVLMLTQGVAPCLPSWPIVEVNLQGRVDGYETDDLIVTVESGSGERRKLLGQVKRSISVTGSSSVFGEVIQAAWNDFCNPKVFDKGKDVIALITGPLSSTDENNVKWLFEQARCTKDADEFLTHVNTTHFSSEAKRKKLSVIKEHLKNANNKTDVSKEDLHHFFKCFYFLGYDLGTETGVVLSLIQSHISLFQKIKPEQVWQSIVYIVQNWNQNAGTLTQDCFPEDIKDLFKMEGATVIPEVFEAPLAALPVNWNGHPNATLLAQLSLIGSWDGNSQSDINVLSEFFGENYEVLVSKVREILHAPNSPISFKNGLWEVLNRFDLLNGLGSRILDQDMDRLKSAVLRVLGERDPIFELEKEERFSASINGIALEHSQLIRNGLLKGLALVSSNPNFISSISENTIRAISDSTVHDLLTNADSTVWGSLNDQLPLLAEVSPNVFIAKLEESINLTPSTFVELFDQEESGITGRTYLTGTLWALEGLAWDQTYLVRSCVALAGLAEIDPGGNWGNRPANSLATILLPWLPQTIGSVDKRFAAVKTLCREHPIVGWSLLIKLLPGQQRSSSGSHKPIYRQVIPSEWAKEVSGAEYHEQSQNYSELAVELAQSDPAKIAELVDNIDHLTKQAFDNLLEILCSDIVIKLPEDEKMLIWSRLNRMIKRHRRFSDAKWSMPQDILSYLEQVAKNISPIDPLQLYQNLFTSSDGELLDGDGEFSEQRQRLRQQRISAISEIFEAGGLDMIFEFASSIKYPNEIGNALAELEIPIVDETILPNFLDSKDHYKIGIASSYIWRKYYDSGLPWVDGLDKTCWSKEQIGLFLTYLPFTKEVWDRVDQWLDSSEKKFWGKTSANPYDSDDSLDFAIGKLLKYKRPLVALNCLYRTIHDKKTVDIKQCVQALNEAVSHQDLMDSMDVHYIQEVIKFLQTNKDVSEDSLVGIEWAYLSLLNHRDGLIPRALEGKLAMDSDFFCELIQLVYRSKNEREKNQESSKVEKSMATNAWRLLHDWKTPPGLNSEGELNKKVFSGWFDAVVKYCSKSGHLDVALITVGGVLIYSPADPSGLWIHQKVAEMLNHSSYEKLRRGYASGQYNSRGFHLVDPTGKPEKNLAIEFKEKAEAVENEGYQRFAKTLRDIASSYEADAERIIQEHLGRDGSGE